MWARCELRMQRQSEVPVLLCHVFKYPSSSMYTCKQMESSMTSRESVVSKP